MLNRNSGKVTVTQMASTPTLEGKDAEKLIASLKKRSTLKSRENARKLNEYFKNFES